MQEENIVDTIILSRESFKNDAWLAYQIILKSISKEANTYTYIKLLLHYRDSRRDYLALKEHYSSDASKQAVINTTK